MANAFANGLGIAAQKRPMTKKLMQPMMPQPVLSPRPPTESGFPTQAAAPGISSVTPQPVRQPSLIQDLLRRSRELGI